MIWSTLGRLPVTALSLGVDAADRVVGSSHGLRARVARAAEAVGRAAIGTTHRSVAATMHVLPIREIVDALPVDEIVAKVDLDALLGRVDVNAMLQRVDVAAIVGRIDVEEIVARVDVNAMLERVDVNALVARIDVAGVIAEVLEELDIRSIVRESTVSVAGQTVEAVRTQAMAADEIVARVVDRLLLRRRGRALELSSPPGTA